MPIKPLLLVLGFLGAFLLSAVPAWAVQAHGGAEGLVSHQLGHVLFVVGLGYLLFRLRQLQIRGLDLREFKIFLYLLLAWNILTFSGHWMHELMAPEKFIKSDGHILSFSVSSISDAYFYLTRLDHLLLVPSFCFLLLALRKWRTQ